MSVIRSFVMQRHIYPAMILGKTKFLISVVNKTHCIHLCYKSSIPKSQLASIKYVNQEFKALFGPKLKKNVTTAKKAQTRTSRKKKLKESYLGVVGESFKDIRMTSNDQVKLATDDDDLSVLPNTDTGLSDGIIKAEHTQNWDVHNIELNSYSKIKKLVRPSSGIRKPEVILHNDPLNFVLNYPLISQSSEGGEDFDLFQAEIDKLDISFVPSVTSILSQTQSEMNKFFLMRWKKKMIEELGEEGFRLHQQETLSKGTNLHACIQDFLSGKRESEIQVQPNVEQFWKSVQTALHQVSDVKAVECTVHHPHLLYKGTFDCVAVYRDTLCVIDWKTSSKPKPLLSNTFDNPLQVAGYLGAINANKDSSMFQFGPVTNAVVVVAYPWGDPAHVHFINKDKCYHYWTQWLERLDQYWRSFHQEVSKAKSV